MFFVAWTRSRWNWVNDCTVENEMELGQRLRRRVRKHFGWQNGFSCSETPILIIHQLEQRKGECTLTNIARVWGRLVLSCRRRVNFLTHGAFHSSSTIVAIPLWASLLLSLDRHGLLSSFCLSIIMDFSLAVSQ